MGEEQLIAECRRGSRQAQSSIYNKYAQAMMHTCIRYIPDVMEAEDALIEGFTKVFSKIDQFEFRGKGSFAGWIKRIMINECLMIIRKRKISSMDIDDLLDLRDPQQSDDNLHHQEVMSLLYSLPKGYRTVFNLYVIEGYSHKEIGEKLGISENTSKSQLSKARNSLMKSYKNINAHE